jgi:copper chaperone
MVKTELAIEGMSCGHCVSAVTRALEEVDGVSSAVVDLAGGRAEVFYDAGRVSSAALLEAVAGEGYRATVVSSGSG